jgi:hypothetical protein
LLQDTLKGNRSAMMAITAPTVMIFLAGHPDMT